MFSLFGNRHPVLELVPMKGDGRPSEVSKLALKYLLLASFRIQPLETDPTLEL